MPTTWSSVLNTTATPVASGRQCVRGWRSVHCRCTRRRPGSSSLADTRRNAAPGHGLGKPETFTFLGFTFICSRTRQGKFQVKRKSRRDRMRAKLTELKEQVRRRMHQPIPEQGVWLRQVVTGFFAYHAVPTNYRALQTFRSNVKDLWRLALRRRSQKDRM